VSTERVIAVMSLWAKRELFLPWYWWVNRTCPFLHGLCFMSLRTTSST
jgi:hypothetical protein